MVKYRPCNYPNNFNGELALSESNQPLAGALRNSAEKKHETLTSTLDAKTRTIENYFGIPPIGLEGATVEEARDSSETITAQFSVEMDVDEIAKGSISAKAPLSIDELAKTVQKIQEEQAAEWAALREEQAKDRAVVKALQDKLDEERAATASEITNIHKALDGDLQAIAKIRFRNMITRGEEVFGKKIGPHNAGDPDEDRRPGAGRRRWRAKEHLPMDSVDAQNVLSVLLETAETFRTKGNNAAHERDLDRKFYEEAIERYEYPENVEGAQEKFTSLLRFVGTTEPTANTTTSQSPSQG
ncbi:hypothetical protein BD779DRAFT_1674775 [Infundibulicybe gibba]|nr:hypothetical protein BD779DRAFT_1674775 [Infundibulicybe gibba]